MDQFLPGFRYMNQAVSVLSQNSGVLRAHHSFIHALGNSAHREDLVHSYLHL